MQRKVFSISALLMAGALALTGCGGQSLSEKDDTGGGTPAAANVIPPGDLAAEILKAMETDDELAARVPENIKKNGLRVATADGYPPMEMFDEDGKSMIGVDMSLVRAIAATWGVKLEVSNSDVSAMMPGVVSGRFDLLASGFNDTEVRREKVSFVDYARSSGAIVVQKGNPENITAPEDLCGHTMAVLDNGYYMQLATTYSEECVAAGKPAITVMGFINDPEALLQLQNGRAQAGMNDYPVAVFRAAEAGGAIEAIEIPGDSLFGMAVDPANTDLISLVQDTLNALMEDGSYQKILEAWDLSGMALDEATINQGN